MIRLNRSIAFTVRPDIPEASPTFDEPSRAIELAFVAPAVGPQRRPHAGWPIAGVLAGVLGCVLWFLEAWQMGSIDGGILRVLRGASWGIGAELFAIYALAWLVLGRRTQSRVVHRSYVRRNSWTRLNYITPRRFAADRARR